MNLSNLVTYKHGIELSNCSEIYNNFSAELLKLNNNLKNFNIDFNDIKTDILALSDESIAKVREIDKLFNEFKNALDQLIKTIEPDHYENSEKIYQEFIKNDSCEYILNRARKFPLFTDNVFLDFFKSRLKNYINFQHPALEIRPVDGLLTEVLVGCDPLYIADVDTSLLQPVRAKWNQLYQNRICYYLYNESDLTTLLKMPVNQFGLIVVTEMFNYKSINVIEKYLEIFWTLLRPGGKVMFTFNNCDFPTAIVKYEHSDATYTPGSKVKSISKEIGFNVEYEFTLKDLVSWIELSKPGVLSSIRAGQTLGKIIPMEENT